MSRQKLSEFRAKTILHNALNLPYSGWSIDTMQPVGPQLADIGSRDGEYVVKVDEAVKGRFKKGLVKLNVSFESVAEVADELKAQGYNWLIVEPMAAHDESAERYISMALHREGIMLSHARHGGVDVEQHADEIKQMLIDGSTDWNTISNDTGLSVDQLRLLKDVFTNNFFAFLEINPYIIGDNGLQILDAAVEVDDAAAFFVDEWKNSDFRRVSNRRLTEEEKLVQELDTNSPASLKLSVLEPNGGVFLLLSGGGASVVVADEVYNQGYGHQLANYGEYSGNPNAEETHAYTKALLNLLLKSTASKKVLFIGGAVANFTDVAKTFTGIIKAIDEVSEDLQSQGVKIFVRRGGPNQETGLALMEATLKKYDLLGAVHGPDTPLTVAVTEALKEVSHG